MFRCKAPGLTPRSGFVGGVVGSKVLDLGPHMGSSRWLTRTLYPRGARVPQPRPLALNPKPFMLRELEDADGPGGRLHFARCLEVFGFWVSGFGFRV